MNLTLRAFFYSPLTEKILPLALVAILALVVFPYLISPSDPSRRRLRATMILGGVGIVFASWQLLYIDHDEVEHLHAAWLMSQGILPFRDFWQHHLPTLWILLSPVTSWYAAGSSLVEAARLGSLLFACISGLLAWNISLRIHPGRSVSWPVFLFFWSAMLVPYHWNILRPDPIFTCLNLAGLLLLVSAPSDGLRNRLLAGLCFGAALSFTPKSIVFILLVGTADAFSNPLLERRASILRFVFLTGGIVLGLLPLLLWLHIHRLFELCHFWTFTFNRSFQSTYTPWEFTFTHYSILGIILFAIFRLHVSERTPNATIIIAGIAGGLFPLPMSPTRDLFHIQLATMLTLAALAPDATRLLRQTASERRFVILAIICVAAFLPTHAYTRRTAWAPFSERLIQMDILQDYSKKGDISLIFPEHPILARTVTGFDHGWFWNFLTQPTLHGYLKQPIGSFTEKLMNIRPILVAPRHRSHNMPIFPSVEQERKDLSDYLLNTGFIEKPEHDRLQSFLDRNYRLVNIMNGWFWLRNDIPEIY